MAILLEISSSCSSDCNDNYFPHKCTNTSDEEMQWNRHGDIVTEIFIVQTDSVVDEL